MVHDGFPAVSLLIISILAFGNPYSALAADVRLNMVVSSGGKLANDGKGTYYAGVDYVGIWLDPSRYPTMSFNICTNWPFGKTPLLLPVPPSGVAGARTLDHDMTSPVPNGGGTPLGVFTSTNSNDVSLSKPLTARVRSLTDMAVGTSLSPDSAEARFCNSDCTEYYSLIFGAKSLFYPDLKVDGTGTTKPTVTRTSEATWTISFPAKTIGRLWRRSGQLTNLGLYYYDGNIDIQTQ